MDHQQGGHLKNFVEFACEGKTVSSEVLMGSSVELLKKCPPAREAVLHLFAQLIDEYCTSYVASTCGNSAEVVKVQPLLNRLRESNKTDSNSNVVARKISVDSRKLSSDSSKNAEDSNTPASPPPQGQIDAHQESTVDETTDDSAVDLLMEAIGSTLFELTLSVKDETNSNLKIGSWSLELLSNISAKYAPMRANICRPLVGRSVKLSESITYWTNCSVIALLLKIVKKFLTSCGNSDYDSILNGLIKNSPHTDWLCAHVITLIAAIEEDVSFSNCIEHLSNSSASQESITSILSHLSEHNPRAIINSPKTNIPSLLKLCASSKPLLDVLATEATKEVNIQLLNDLSVTLTDDIINDVLYCLLNAPNAFDLLVLCFEIAVHKEANESVKSQALSFLTAVVNQVHEFVYGSSVVSGGSLPIMEILKDNVQKLVTRAVMKGCVPLRRLQLRLIQLLCVYFKKDFTCRVLHILLSSLKNDTKQGITSLLPHPIISSILKSLRLPFGSEVSSFFIAIIKLPDDKQVHFWINLNRVFEADDSYEMDIDLLVDKFTSLLEEDNLGNLCLLHVLRLLFACMERFPKQVSKPKQILCLALATCYVKVVEAEEYVAKDEDSELNMQLINITQKCMSLLARKQGINQHILCRALLENILTWNDEIQSQENEKEKTWVDISLKDENLSYGGVHGSYKFRKMPLNPLKKNPLSQSKPSHPAIISNLTVQLLLDGVKSCVVDIPSFATLLVECVTPDVMFNDLPWPDEDFLKVTIERDLHITRMFEAYPILWDFCDLIGKEGFLHYCSVLVRALMAVQLTQWASATASKDKLDYTQK